MGRLQERNYSRADSSSHDECHTPHYAYDVLAPFIPKDWVIWESAAGGQYLYWTMLERGHKVIATDIKRTGTDYFFYSPIFDIQITNPPYQSQIKIEWLRRACLLGRFALLLQGFSIFPAGTGDLVDEYGLELIIPAKGVRIDYFMPEKGYTQGGAKFHSVWLTKGLGLPKQLNYVELYKPSTAQVLAEADRLTKKYSNLPPHKVELPKRVMVSDFAVQDTIFMESLCA